MTLKQTKPEAKNTKIRGDEGKAGAGASENTFDVLVLATMSAGKSSFINALLGRELLPSANVATTACLTSIAHRRTAKSFRAACYSHTGTRIGVQKDASADHVRAWNADSQVRHIQLSGRFDEGTRLASGLVVHDTPGPNNSQDGQHEALMLDAVRTVPFKLLCYVLNAGQLGTWDDRRLLERLRALLARRRRARLVFILNKVDLLDPEQGEDLPLCVGKARDYLEGLGFARPIIIPTMANLALCARKALNAEPLTRVERTLLRQSLEGLDGGEDDTLHAAAMPETVRASVRKHLEKGAKARQPPADAVLAGDVAGLEQLVVRSGIRTVEFFLNQRSISA